MPVALIVGAFGQDNPGDEALLDASVQSIRRCEGWEPLVATARPLATAGRLGVPTIAATPAATGAAAARADALVVGGGTLFKELHPSSGRAPGALLRRAAVLVGAMHSRRRPVALLGVGAAPMASGLSARLTRGIARRTDLLVLRDAPSADLLVAAGVPGPLRVGADLTWLTAASAERADRPEGVPLGVAMSHLAGDETLLQTLAVALRHVVEGGRPVELEPWQGSPRLGADARMAASLAARVGDGAAVVAPPRDLSDAIARARGRSLTVSLRFHSAVASASAGTPFVAISHEPKLAAIAERMSQPAVGSDASPGALMAAIEAALAGGGPDRAAVVEQVRRAEATADLLSLVLTGQGRDAGLSHLDLVPHPVPA